MSDYAAVYIEKEITGDHAEPAHPLGTILEAPCARLASALFDDANERPISIYYGGTIWDYATMDNALQLAMAMESIKPGGHIVLWVGGQDWGDDGWKVRVYRADNDGKFPGGIK